MDGDAAMAAQSDCHGEREQFPGLGMEPACFLTGTAESDVSFHRVRAELPQSAHAGQNLLSIAIPIEHRHDKVSNAFTRNKMRSERSRAMFERLKGCADRINDQLGPHKASARSGSVDRHRAFAACAPGNPGNLEARRAMGGGASSGAGRLGTVSYCDQGTLLSRAALRRAPAAPGRPASVAAAW